jgi:hypothetical protein
MENKKFTYSEIETMLFDSGVDELVDRLSIEQPHGPIGHLIKEYCDSFFENRYKQWFVNYVNSKMFVANNKHLLS